MIHKSYPFPPQELPEWAHSAPADLVAHTRRTARAAGCLYAGENALPRLDRRAFEQVLAVLLNTRV
jgi:hypothetical protein